MEQEVKAFLNKFIAALCRHEVDSIPFAGDAFQNGMSAMEKKLRDRLSPDDFEKIADVFVKDPVDEVYEHIRSLFMTLNGSGISFSGADNPQWRVMTIKMTPYLAERILKDATVLDMGKDLMDDVTKEFCEAAGVFLWEEC